MPAGGYDAVVVGAGPNGLAAAVEIARAGRSVLLLEGEETIGGGCRTAELTLPGYLHDVCSAIHPLAAASPFLRRLPLEERGLEWVVPPAALAHPFDDGGAVLLEHSLQETAEGLDGPADRAAYLKLMGPLVADWPRIEERILGPLGPPGRELLPLLRFGLRALRSASGLAAGRFSGERARGLLAGLAAHSILPLERAATAAVALVLGLLAHLVGWPFPRRGAGAIAEALAALLRDLGGEIRTGRPVMSLSELPPARAVLLDVPPRQLLEIAGERLPQGYRRRLARFRHGPGVFKLDLAIDGPIPWRAPGCGRAATVHLGGTLAEIAEAERRVWAGEHPQRPFVLLAQQSLFDDSRAPAGRHTVWAYCHVPHGSRVDMSEAIESQIERFAPGFRDRILGRSGRTAAQLEAYNPNLVGGDIAGGVTDLGQLFARPVARRVPYATPSPGLYICSASTPPGGGVHGMCGYHAARAALSRDLA